MRLHRLEIEGFGPFRGRQVVDFDRFADDGIFLIAGRTGAGKSSILDAVCFGLYGSVPRYESGDRRLRSDHCEPNDPSEVVVEFSTTAGRYRVTRSPEYMRPAKRGGGLTKQTSAVQLDTLSGDEWITLAAKEKRVADELKEILQLTVEQFLQVILLAQNRFARFLLADSKERQALLRRLFGTERFDDVQSRFDERRRTAEAELAGVLATVSARIDEAERVVTTAELWGKHGEQSDSDQSDSDQSDEGAADAVPDDDIRPTTTEGRLSALRAALVRAEYQVERRGLERDAAERNLTAADAALADRREEQKAQRERDRARAAVEQLDAEQHDIDEARAQLKRARAAEALRATITAADRARDAHDAAVAAEASVRESWEATGVDIDGVDAADLEEWAAERTREIGAWQHAADLEQGAQPLAAEVAGASEQVTAASARVEAAEAAHAEQPTRLAELTAQRDASRRGADRLEGAAAALTAAKARHEGAVQAETLVAEVSVAERALAEASEALASQQATLAQLRRRRLDGIAGELASDLVDGEPCAVCGSTAHPSPAEHTDPVSADDIARAEVERDSAVTAERTAHDRVGAARAAHAAAEARAESRTVAAAETELAAAADAHTVAQRAAERLDAAQSELDAFIAQASEREKERSAAATALAAAKEELALVTQRSDEAQKLIADARADFATVGERIASVSALLATARSFAAALTEEQRRAEASAEAQTAQSEALAASDFDDATAAHEALRPVAEQDALDARITAHTVQRAKEREILFALEMRALPEEPLDLAQTEQAAATARTEWTAAVDLAGRAQATAEQLTSLIDTAATAHSQSARQQSDYDVVRGLADTIAGRAGNTHKMTLETFVLAAELEEIVEAANRRLSDMSTGRYQLQHSDALAARGAASGLGIVVFDAFTGQTRPAQSLSGGETFLSSLALALGLAEVVTARAGGIQLDTLFIDEGFGSLDADTLDIAMRTLDELRSGGRTVGIISHVESMQEQLPAQLVVEQTPAGPSRIRS
ncbi:SMC family ATPase [Microbacterium sp.]|uniref:AAA family ATPase n=1 Tax=Microbacterium sp. TaxID=51671 RepID=UPI0026294166|nr:SMC family ATPase [Microbacterium sp.]